MSLCVHTVERNTVMLEIIIILETFGLIGMYAFCVYLVNRVSEGCDAERRKAFEDEVGPVTDLEWASVGTPSKRALDELRRKRWDDDMPF